ncbi:MAG: DUF4038 domain-containing protein, partial [Candidatus Poribacteria bacterium]|nr:DUF4038 domain-containing protein [Candidatus Poribacteria bacterium]
VVWSSYPKATDEYVPVVRELAAGFEEGDGGAHLITVHPDPSPASSSWIHAESWLAFNCQQPWNHYELLPSMVAHDYALTPTKPVVMAEAGYEGVKDRGLDAPHALRKQAYWTHLGGAHHSYGHDRNWRAPETWRDWIDSPGAHHLGVYREIVSSLAGWERLIPDPSILVDSVGEGLTRNMAARAESGEWVIAYLSDPTTVTARMDAPSTSTVAASWINPTNGDKTRIGRFPARSQRLKVGKTPFS